MRYDKDDSDKGAQYVIESICFAANVSASANGPTSADGSNSVSGATSANGATSVTSADGFTSANNSINADRANSVELRGNRRVGATPLQRCCLSR